MQVIIDRFEGEYAVCERSDGCMVDIKKNKLPAGAVEGDMLSIEGTRIILDRMKTEQRRTEIQRLMDEVWE